MDIDDIPVQPNLKGDPVSISPPTASSVTVCQKPQDSTIQQNAEQNNKQIARRTTSTKHQHTYRLLVKAHSSDKEQENFTRKKVLQTILLALQKGDSLTSLVVPSDDQFQKRVYSTISPESKNKSEYEKIENLLHFTNTNSIQGTIQISSHTIYSTIKKISIPRKFYKRSFRLYCIAIISTPTTCQKWGSWQII
jgi:hypothetical protein